MSQKTHEGKLGSIIRYDKVMFGIQEFFVQIESSIVNNNLQFVMEILAIFSLKEEEDILAKPDDFKKSLTVQRKDLCPVIDASQGIVFDEKQINVDKVSFGMIHIASIHTQLTFKLQKKSFDFDFTNPRAMFGILNMIYPFISSLASITDSTLKFNELIIIEGYYS